MDWPDLSNSIVNNCFPSWNIYCSSAYLLYLEVKARKNFFIDVKFFGIKTITTCTELTLGFIVYFSLTITVFWQHFFKKKLWSRVAIRHRQAYFGLSCLLLSFSHLNWKVTSCTKIWQTVTNVGPSKTQTKVKLTLV